LPLWIGIDPRWGVAGLTASAGIAGWVEFALLRHGLHRRFGPEVSGAGPLVSGFIAKLWLAAALAVVVGSAGRLLPFASHPIPGAIATLGPFALVYLVVGATFAPEARQLVTRLLQYLSVK
jgi:putative peptidoglycan lipid II flippase